jgi:hypothetical protein
LPKEGLVVNNDIPQEGVGADLRVAVGSGPQVEEVAPNEGLVANKNLPQGHAHLTDGTNAFVQCLGREYQGITVPQLKNKWTLQGHNLAIYATKAYMNFVLEKINPPKKNPVGESSDDDSDDSAPYAELHSLAARGLEEHRGGYDTFLSTDIRFWIDLFIIQVIVCCLLRVR